MTERLRHRGWWVAGGIAAAALVVSLALSGSARSSAAGAHAAAAEGEARQGSLTLALAPAVSGVAVIQARVAGRPLVVVDAGHGGHDPGATSVSGSLREKQVTLALAEAVRDRLARNGRVRIALTRSADDTLTLDERASIARRLGAGLFLSIHADSAPNPLARGATVYSLSDVASDADAARFAAHQNAGEPVSTEADGSVRALLAGLAVHDEMEDSADFASRLVRRAAASSVALRPDPHRFASFRVLRSARAPAVLFEAGYLSNVDDEKMLASPEGRERIAAALAETIEAELARQSVASR
ncbi:N-acetylmuramoyl-L-alanine amidase [Sphingomonas ginkgonis]|uniref:N-acetylmuramoyl-L-alanine amidase n=1 Tax=Sphingomonas ginkgonis TaxID=2315330 RepID=A0A3R9YNQ1_9SPHN|nr:N-acetylmuramoyl-L-alanine amidase [Sphingomonas ginkgonis]RST31917.1 N-acetylmuramoyl-L-alanine amidase [Sphingomonas ginkgonis]